MYFKIKLKEKTSSNTTIYLVQFPINLKSLESATKNTYSNLGTQYAPIRADNFISLNGNEFPFITPDSKLVISLVTEEEDEKYESHDARLICCKVKNVGKSFNNNAIEILDSQWEPIFDLDNKQLLSAPDGTLYISPDKQKKCVIQIKKGVLDSYLSYSILFSLIIDKRTYYFILDPVLEITSSRKR